MVKVRETTESGQSEVRTLVGPFRAIVSQTSVVWTVVLSPYGCACVPPNGRLEMWEE